MAGGDDFTCAIEGCEKPRKRRLCSMHAARVWRHGSPHVTLKTPDGEPKSLILKTVRAEASDDQCIEWPYAMGTQGYGLYHNNGRPVRVHRYVCALAHGPAPRGSKSHASHLCGNRKCFNPRHLRWATAAENTQDKILHGRSPRGERHHNCKLTKQQAIHIYSLRGKGLTQKKIAEKYGVSRGAISAILHGRTWSHTTGANHD